MTDRDEWSDICNEEIVGMIRWGAKSVFGGNETFVDDDLRRLVNAARNWQERDVGLFERLGRLWDKRRAARKVYA